MNFSSPDWYVRRPLCTKFGYIAQFISIDLVLSNLCRGTMYRRYYAITVVRPHQITSIQLFSKFTVTLPPIDTD